MIQIHRYGIEIGRLLQAQIEAKKGYDIARRGGVAPAVLQDTKVLPGVYWPFISTHFSLSSLYWILCRRTLLVLSETMTSSTIRMYRLRRLFQSYQSNQ